MKISEFSQRTGLSAHTLRYYEKIGLLTVSRDASGHGYYTAKDLEWFGFSNRLRKTSMPLKEIKKYALWRAQGDATLKQRQALLEQHAKRLAKLIADEQQHLQALQAKIDFYQKLA